MGEAYAEYSIESEPKQSFHAKNMANATESIFYVAVTMIFASPTMAGVSHTMVFVNDTTVFANEKISLVQPRTEAASHPSAGRVLPSGNPELERELSLSCGSAQPFRLCPDKPRFSSAGQAHPRPECGSPGGGEHAHQGRRRPV